MQFDTIQVALRLRLRRSPDDVAELERMVERLADLAERYPAIRAWRCSLVATHAELGHLERGAQRVRAARRGRLRGPPARRAVDGVARPCSPRRRRRSATSRGPARLYELLAPYEGYAVVAGRAAACYGPVARYLGLLAEVTGAHRRRRAPFRRRARVQRADGRPAVRGPDPLRARRAAARARRRGRPRAGARAARPGARRGAGARDGALVERARSPRGSRRRVSSASTSTTSIDYMIAAVDRGAARHAPPTPRRTAR